MKRSTARWTTSLAAAALLGLPTAGMAQTPTTARPPATTAQQPGAPTTAQPDSTHTAATQAQVDQEAARRHLTDARDTLTQLTQLPAAAQMSGDARTQVSQLIANFNELITTKSEWRASYTKVAANLDALLGPDNTDAEATGGVSAGTTGTTGAVGTSGTTAATANLDPAIRAKLVELRQKLSQFEKASGTGTPATEAMGHEEAMRHIAAIEAILNANGAGVTLASAQLEQLRTHLTELKRLMNDAKK